MAPEVNKINNICKKVKNLTKEEIDEVCEIFQDQVSYISPLKGSKQKKVNELGQYNLKVMNKLKELKEVIDSYKSE